MTLIGQQVIIEPGDLETSAFGLAMDEEKFIIITSCCHAIPIRSEESYVRDLCLCSICSKTFSERCYIDATLSIDETVRLNKEYWFVAWFKTRKYVKVEIVSND